MSAFSSNPSLYLAFQGLVGAKRARRLCVEDYVPAREGQRVLDIGCGPGYILEYLPKCDYVGFDINQGHIAYASRRYAGRGRFFCREFDAAAAAEFGPFDLILMNGLLHHLDDAGVVRILTLSKKALKPGGRAITLDGCYAPGQSPISRMMLDRDDGKFVRDEPGYTALISQVFAAPRKNVREGMMFIPYTLVIYELS